MSINFIKEIDNMRLNFNQNCKKIKIMPSWMAAADDPLNIIYSELPKLVKTGEVHYAHLVQANTNLFNSFPPYNYPAGIVYSTDSHYNKNPYELGEIALKLYEYKGTHHAPKSLKRIVESITDEYTRLFNAKLLTDDSEKSEVFFTTLMVYRKHLPKRKLCKSTFPIIANPNFLQSTVILPKKYWTSNFIDYFNGKIY